MPTDDNGYPDRLPRGVRGVYDEEGDEHPGPPGPEMTPDVNDIKWTIDRLQARDHPAGRSPAGRSPAPKTKRMRDEELQERIKRVATGRVLDGKGLF